MRLRENMPKKGRGHTRTKTAEDAGPLLLTVKPAARFLGVSEWGLRELAWRGLLPVVRFPQPDGSPGRKWYFHVRDLQRLVEQHKSTVS